MTPRNGFSLLELVAVLAMFALVALIGVQVLQASVRTSARLTEVSEASRDIGLGLALLRRDLGNAVPRGFDPPSGGRVSSVQIDDTALALSVGGLGQLDPGSTGFGRVEWRYDPGQGQLTRRVWTSLHPGPARPVAVAVFTDLTGFRAETYRPGAGWVAGHAADPRNPDRLPIGLRVTLTHARHGALTIVESLR